MCSVAIVECWIVVGRRIGIVIAASVNMCVGSNWWNERFHKKYVILSRTSGDFCMLLNPLVSFFRLVKIGGEGLWKNLNCWVQRSASWEEK